VNQNELNSNELEQIAAGKPSFAPKFAKRPNVPNVGNLKPGIDPNSVKKPTSIKPGQVALDLP
jgi:hypothetical protein